jgi:hypothetical protein
MYTEFSNNETASRILMWIKIVKTSVSYKIFFLEWFDLFVWYWYIFLDWKPSYPSGNLAIAITSVQLGQFNYVVQADTEKSSILAVFEPNGYASCYHHNGVLRYVRIDMSR